MKALKKSQIDSIKSLISQGKSIRQVSGALNLSIGVVQKYAVGCQKQKIKKGRPRKLRESDIEYCVLSILSDKADGATDLVKKLRAERNVIVSRKTIARALKERGLKAGEKKKKPLLSSKNVRDRLKFAKAHQHWTVEDWRNVVFSDETKINRFNSDGRKWTWYREGSSLNSRRVTQTVKNGGGNIKIWGCITSKGVGHMCKIENNLDSFLYLEILKGELVDTFKLYRLNESKTMFQHDNDPKHTAIKVKKYLQKQKFETLWWPSQSPDLNPMEHIWVVLKQALNRYKKPASGMLELWDRVQLEWEKISKETCLKFIDSMPKRMSAVIKAKGSWTKY
jgi:transposase